MSGPADPDGDGVHLEVTASGEATVNQAGRDLHVHFSKGIRRTIQAPDGTDGGCPYPGLAAFTADQAAWFFGRDRLTAGLVSRLDACATGGGPVMVAAASGAGKSSLLRAGLLPKVAAGALTPAGSRHWPRVVFTPGAHPMRAAASALLIASATGIGNVPPDPSAGDLDGLLAGAVAAAGPGARAVLVVDQFEELFRLCGQDERGAFISWLWRAACGESPGGPAALAACAVRADFYPDCTRYPQIRQALQDTQVIVGAMSPEELREAITSPAEAVGLDIEPGLTDLLLSDLHAGYLPAAAGIRTLAADDDAGRLPLLAHALRVTWQQRHGSTLTVDGYRTAGGIEHAIADSAEQCFAGLDTAARHQARGLFLRLVKIGATSGEDVRRTVPRTVLAGDSRGAAAVVDAYTAARLLTQTLATVQITHEALLRAWPRLAGWLDDDRAGQLTRQRTEDDAAEWDQVGRDPSLLYRGGRLETAAGWAGHHNLELTATARHFVTASRRLARRTRLIKRTAITVLAVLLLLASVTSAVAVIQRSTAVSQSRLAQSEEKTAQSEAMADEATNLLPANGPLAMLLSMQAYERAHTVPAASALLQAAQQPLDDLLPSGSPVESVAFSPDGRTLAAGDDAGHVGLWDVATGQRTATLAEGSKVYGVAFSPDGRMLAAGDDAGHVGLWDVATGQRTATLAEGSTVWSVAFSRDGRTLAAGDGTGHVGLWDVATGQRTAALAEGSTVYSVAFSPDGRTLAAGDLGGHVGLWDVATGQRTAALAEGITVDSVAFSPDGRTLAAGDDGSLIGLWDVATGRRTATLAEVNSVYSVAFSPDRRTLAAGDAAGHVGLWDVATGRRTATLAEGKSVWSVAFSPDGRTLAAGDLGGHVGLWDVTAAQRANVTEGSPVEGVAFSPDGRTLAAGDAAGHVGLWDVATGQRTATLAEGSTVYSVAFSPDGRTLAASDWVGGVVLWDVAAGQSATPTKTATLTEGNTAVNDVAFSPDGRTLAAGDAAGHVGLWDVATGRRTANLADGNSVYSVAFSPDGAALVTGDSPGNVSVWSAADGQQSASLAEGGTVSSLAFSPHGQVLAIGNLNGDIALLWQRLTNLTQPLFTHLICGKVRANMTRPQWAEYAPGQPYQKTCP